MHPTTRRIVTYATLVVSLAALYITADSCRRNHSPEKPFVVGLVTWIGYGPVYVAQAKRFFEDEHLDLQVKVLDGPGAREAAYQAGNLDFFPNTPDAFAIFFAEQSPAGTLIAGLDESQ